MKRRVEDGSLDLELVAKQLLENREDDLKKTAESFGVEPALLEFVVGQLMRPLAERKASRITPLPEELQWLKGYCPICGSWPSLTYIEGEGGRRWLKCSFCSHEWRFMRTQCPFCENMDFDLMEYYYAEDRESERVEVCHACKRYIVGVDLRKVEGEAVLDVIPMGLIYLDVLAQGQGLKPGATTEWNVFEKPSE
jgi:FdhE protein